MKLFIGRILLAVTLVLGLPILVIGFGFDFLEDVFGDRSQPNYRPYYNTRFYWEMTRKLWVRPERES